MAVPSVESALLDGAFRFLYGATEGAANLGSYLDRLQNRYPALTRQGATSILYRYFSGLEGAAWLRRSRTNRLLSDDMYARTYGLPSRYRYTVVATFNDLDRRTTFTRAFDVDSSQALGKLDILAAAQPLIDDFAQRETGTNPRQVSFNNEYVDDSARITFAGTDVSK